MTPTVDRDEQLATLLAELTEQQRLGQTPDIEAVAREHPHLADELRALWATAQFAAVFVPSSNPHTPIQQETGIFVPSITPLQSFGDFELLDELGRGGMGVVYKARQRSLNRMVAIKLMRDSRLSSEADRARFRAEAAAVAKLKHPNIVTVHEVGENAGQPFFVMEYVEGKTLAQLLNESPVKPREAARLMVDIARAIQHAHDQGLLHRDLKPSNILLTSTTSGRDFDSTLTGSIRVSNSNQMIPKVTDFGLAKRFIFSQESIQEWRTQTGNIVGTPSYMAPEQASSRRDLTPAADIYSLGAILYELLTGRPPFMAANPVDTILMAMEQEPVPPRWLDPGIDRELEMICLKCLQKPPQLRYASANQLAQDLESFLSGESISSQPSGLRYFIERMLRETHHISVLENWGLLWMWHSLATFLLCLLTQILAWCQVTEHYPYLILWSVGLCTWGAILWRLRARAGPVLFVERQIAHAWAAGVCASIATFLIEVLIDQPALTLSPVIAMAAGMVFVFKAGILSGRFYITATAMFLTAIIMPLLPEINILLFGLATSLCFFVPGLKYYRLRQRAKKEMNEKKVLA